MNSPQPAGARLNIVFVLLVMGFGLSQAFRTLPSVMIPALEAEFSAGSAALAYIGTCFHLSFALMQLPIGLAIDRLGVRWPLVLCLALAAIGAALGAAAGSIEMLYVASTIIGIGCAPALIAGMVVIGRCSAPESFAARAGLLMALGSFGILLTSLPFAWMLAAYGWRSLFAALAGAGVVLAGLALWHLPKEHNPAQTQRHPTLWNEIKSFGLLPLQALAGLLAIAFVAYATVLTVRSLWVLPLLQDRHGMTIETGASVMLAFSLAIALSPLLIGRLRGLQTSPRRATCFCGLVMSAACFVLAVEVPGNAGLVTDVSTIVMLGLLSGMSVLIYAQVRQIVPISQSGRALSLVNFFVFLGIATAQTLSGWMGQIDTLVWGDRYVVMLLSLGLFCLAGTVLYTILPGPDLPKKKTGC